MEHIMTGFLFFSTLFFLVATYVEAETVNNGWVITGWATSSVLGIISLALHLTALDSVGSIKIVLTTILSCSLLVTSLIVLVLSVVNMKRFFRSREEKINQTSPDDRDNTSLPSNM